MPSETIIMIFLITISLILGISLVIVIQDLFRLEKRLQKSEEENSGYKNALQKEADIVMDDAHKRAMNLVDEANRKAMEIVSSSETYNATSQEALKQSMASVIKAENDQIQKVGTEMLATYQETLKEVQTEGNEVIQNMSKDLEKQALEEVAAFTQTVKQGTIESEKLIQERLNAELQQAEKDVAVYKQTQMKKAEDQIFTLVRFLTESAIGKGLTIEQHQALVTEALEEAKAQGVLR